MSPIMLNSVHWNSLKCLDNPLNNKLSHRRFDHRNIDAWIQHPIFPIIVNKCLQCLANSNINRLAKRNIYTRDVLHFYTKLLDCLHHSCHHVASVESNTSSGTTFSDAISMNGLRIFLTHSIIIPHPSIHFPDNNIYSQVENLGILFLQSDHFQFLEISIESNIELSAHTDTARVALFFIICWSTKVLWFCSFPFQCFLEFQVTNIGVWPMFMISFGSKFWSLALGQICCMKSNASAADSPGDLCISWVSIQYFKEWLLPLPFLIFPKSHSTNQMPCNTQYMMIQQSLFL